MIPNNVREQLFQKLRHYCSSGILYGSQCYKFDPNKDIDLLLVYENSTLDEIVSVLSKIQSELKYLIHPILINKSDLSRNPMLKAIKENGIKLW